VESEHTILNFPVEVKWLLPNSILQHFSSGVHYWYTVH